MTRALIIGAGPAGLLAAHGAWTAGAEVSILDAHPAYRPGTIFSLQYLHEPCGLELAVRRMLLFYRTTERSWPGYDPDRAREAYNRKLGRPEGEENSTRFLFNTPVAVWSLKDAYRTLWSMYKGMIREQPVTWSQLIQYCEIYDVVISTAPLDKLLPDLVWPVRTGLIAMGWLPFEVEHNTCVYSLDPDVLWYRATRLDGGMATEFIRRSDTAGVDIMLRPGWPTVQPLRKVKDHRNVIGPRPGNLTLTGRWGSWDPAKLTHDAYKDARRAVLDAQESVPTTG